MGRIAILVVDDEAVIREGLQRTLDGERFAVETCRSGHAAIELLQDKEYDLIITDLKMPGMNGIEVLKAVKGLQPDVPVIMITGYATVDTAVEAMKNGATDYISKPFTPEQIMEKIDKSIEQRAVMVDDMYLIKEISSRQGFDAFVGDSREMQKVYRRIIQVASSDSTVLITGESGTGKELVARAIHRSSSRRDQPFVALDCSSLAENLLESELFGHVKGSFTGAIQTKTGLFRVADGGTLFLDEVANISLSTQAKLLRVLQERMVTPIGGTQPIPINIHLVAATNRSLKVMVSEGTFREDLFFRLNIIPIDLPPLRERKGDIQLITRHFLQKYNADLGKQIRGIAPDALAFLEEYPFPGNVRELENTIERAVVLAEGDIIHKEDLELVDKDAHEPVIGSYVPTSAEELKEMKRHIRDKAVEDIEKAFVMSALERNNWNVTHAAEETGILRPNFQGMLKRLGISIKSQFAK
jgi:DNA-binding NtrC family response regulator